jgi:hypothetical protein
MLLKRTGVHLIIPIPENQRKMTAAKTALHQPSTKPVPKMKLNPPRCVFFGNSNNNNDNTTDSTGVNDDGLQSMNKRRRYKRRGSRAPSMFVSTSISENDHEVFTALKCLDHLTELEDNQGATKRRRGLMMASMDHLNESLSSLSTCDPSDFADEKD